MTDITKISARDVYEAYHTLAQRTKERHSDAKVVAYLATAARETREAAEAQGMSQSEAMNLRKLATRHEREEREAREKLNAIMQRQWQEKLLARVSM